MSKRPNRQSGASDRPLPPPLPSWTPAARGARLSSATLLERADAIREEVATRGHAVVSVVGASARASWTYTVGLGRRFGAPEIVIVAMDDFAAEGLIDAVVATFPGTGVPIPGRAPRHRLEVNGWEGAYEVCFLQIDADLVFDSALLGVARALEPSAGSILGALQFVCSDDHGSMPWEPEYRAELCPPLLDHPTDLDRLRYR